MAHILMLATIRTMKTNLIIFLVLLTLFACDNVSDKSKKQNQTREIDLSTSSISNEESSEKDIIGPVSQSDTVQTEKESTNLESFGIDNFLIGRFLIGKEAKLVGYNSLNIKGDRLYEFDENGNITATYFGISNNYDNYSYDKSNRLIKVERKQHNPPETYGITKYYYSENDEIIKVITTKLENNLPVKIDTLNDRKSLANLEPNYYKRLIKQKYFSNINKNIVTTVQDNLSFCCGFIMKGKNELTYYLNDDELIDSLVIKGIDNNKSRTLLYEYK